jgi:hypothetical protein
MHQNFLLFCHCLLTAVLMPNVTKKKRKTRGLAHTRILGSNIDDAIDRIVDPGNSNEEVEFEQWKR